MFLLKSTLYCMSRCILEMLSGLGMETGRGRILWVMLCAWNAAVVMMRTTSCCVMVRAVRFAVLVVTLLQGLGDFVVLQHRPLMIDLAHHQGFELAACTQTVSSYSKVSVLPEQLTAA